MTSHMLGKKTRLGTRVAVPVSELHYAPATVQAIRNDVNGNEILTVKFDDNRKMECLSSLVVGNRFKKLSDVKLNKYQKVFTVYNGREVAGYVEEHSDGGVIISLKDFEKDIIRRPLEEIRLTESRYSPRLQEQDIDYRKIASVNASPNHGKKRQVSASIEVPAASRARKSSAEPTMDELMAAMVLSSLSSSPVFHNPKSPSVKRDSSPHSYGSSGVGSWNQDIQMSPIRYDSPHTPHGASLPTMKNFSSTPERSRSVIQLAHSAGHSPASTGDPIEVDTSGMDTPMEEDIREDSKPSGGMVPSGQSTPAPFQSGSPHHQFQVAPGSSPQNPLLMKQVPKLESVQEEMNDREDERQQQPTEYKQPLLYYIPSLIPANPAGLQTIRPPEYMVNMQQVRTPPPPLAPPDDRPLRESPFPAHHQIPGEYMIPSPDDNRVYMGSAPASYYTIPITWSSSPLSTSPLTFTPITHLRHTPSPLASGVIVSSAPATAPMQTVKLPVKSHPVPISAYKVMQDHPYQSQTAQPINIPQAKPFSWHPSMAQSFSPKPNILQQRQQMHHAASPKMSPKTISIGRKIRGDGKKCRKVYGMENRDMWCTACRWKKACQRFPD